MTRRQRFELSALVVMLGAAIGAAAYWSRPMPASRPSAFPVTRVAAPMAASELEVADLTGRLVRLRDLRGRVVLLNFWATWCAPCREEMPALGTLATELGPRGLTVVGVNLKESKSAIEAFLRERQLSIPVLLDKQGEVAQRYQVYALPATFVLDRRGMVVGTVLGPRDWVGPDARGYLGQLLTEPEV